MRDALASGPRLVVVEAPAGCGKTYTGAEWADGFGARMGGGRVLVLTHTHAAADVFSARIAAGTSRVEIRTIDSLIHEVAGTYHNALDLPSDTAAWALGRKDGYAEVAIRVGRLVKGSHMIGRALAQRYPILICDEHQDATEPQEAIIRSMLSGGARVCILGDPMQGIYPDGSGSSSERWRSLVDEADKHIELHTPHRWAGGSEALGEWILTAREDLRDGRQLDLRHPPGSVTVIRADYSEPGYGAFRLDKRHASPVWSLLDDQVPLLVLNPHNKTVEGIRAYFRRRLPIWEGHTRDELDRLVSSLRTSDGKEELVCDALIKFLAGVTTGFSASKFGDRLRQEVAEGCTRPARGKRPVALQAIGREIIAECSHIGVANALKSIKRDPVFAEVKIDYPREYWDAVRLGRFPDPDDGLAELSRQRSRCRVRMPSRAVSTVHKAKGLEFERVVILPCDLKYFADNEKNRRLLYVAISRATGSLVLVVPRDTPSKLLRFR